MTTPTRQRVELLDTTLRDGSYSIDFQFTAEDTALISSALESAGVRMIEIAHGLGLGAHRKAKIQQAATDEAYLRAAASVLKKARFGAFFIPGIGNEDDIRMGADCGLQFIRIGTNVTELHEAEPYVALAKKFGMFVFSNPMKSYAVPPEAFGNCAKRAQEFGADVICLVDSAGGMLPEEVKKYVQAARASSSIQVGFHGHDNLCLAIANTLEAFKAGARFLDASLQGMGRSEGNAVTEVLVAIMQKRGRFKKIDVNALLDASEAFIRPMMYGRRRSPIGITSGRARFHSSFLSRLITAATQHAVDVRELILRVCEHDVINAPEKLVQSLAEEMAAGQPKVRVRVDFASTPAEAPQQFEDKARARALELREKASKLGKRSVMNIVVGPYELTSVSPHVETNYGVVMSNIMLADPDALPAALRAVDGLADFVLLDSGGEAVPEGALERTVLLTYSDHDMWSRATVAHLSALFGGSVYGRYIAITGVPALAVRAAAALSEQGAIVCIDPSLTPAAGTLAAFGQGSAVLPFEEIAPRADAVVSLSPRTPAVHAEHVHLMKSGAILYDGGIGSLDQSAVAAAEIRGVRVYRVDMRPSLAAAALELIGTRTIVNEHAGRADWDGVSVVAGGLIGREGEIIVDSITRPTRIIGVADGKGGIYQALHDDSSVIAVRRAIAKKLLEHHETTD
jgi:4-hydroxy 2-oxovalerate aldolase